MMKNTQNNKRSNRSTSVTQMELPASKVKRLDEAFERRKISCGFALQLQNRSELNEMCPGQYWKINDRTIPLALDVEALVAAGITNEIRVIDSAANVRMINGRGAELASTSLDILDGVASIVHFRAKGNGKPTLNDVLSLLHEPGTILFLDLPATDTIEMDGWAMFPFKMPYDGRRIYTLIRRYTGGQVSGINLPHGVEARRYNAWLHRRIKKLYAELYQYAQPECRCA